MLFQGDYSTMYAMNHTSRTHRSTIGNINSARSVINQTQGTDNTKILGLDEGKEEKNEQ